MYNHIIKNFYTSIPTKKFWVGFTGDQYYAPPSNKKSTYWSWLDGTNARDLDPVTYEETWNGWQKDGTRIHGHCGILMGKD